MIVAIHQPNFIPWLGYFHKLMYSDLFIFLEDVQYSKNSFTNRNRIKTPQGTMWLTIPVKSNSQSCIQDVVIADKNWKIKCFKSLQACYGKAPYYQAYMPSIAEIIEANDKKLSELNKSLIIYIAEVLGLKCKIVSSTDFKIQESSDRKIARLVSEVGGDTYLSGHGAANYQSDNTYLEFGVKCVYHRYQPCRYPQLWGEFEANLSAIDALFNCGPQGTLELLSN